MGRSPSNSTSGEEGELPASPDDMKKGDDNYGRQDKEKGNYDDSDEDVTRRRQDDERSHTSWNKDNVMANNGDEKESHWPEKHENRRHSNGRVSREDNDRKDSRHNSDSYNIDSEKGDKKREFEEKYGAGKRGDDGYRKDKKKVNEDERDEKRESRRGRDNTGKGQRRASDERCRGRYGGEESEVGERDGKDEKKTNENERYNRRESWRVRDDSENEHNRKSKESSSGRDRDREEDGDDNTKHRSKANKDVSNDTRDSRRERNEHNEDKGRRRNEIGDENEDSDSDSDSDRKNRRRGNGREKERQRVKRREDGAKDRRRDRDEGNEKYKRENEKRRSQQEDKNVGEEVDRGNVNVEPNVDQKNLGRSGGVYIPPFKLARMMKEVQDKSSLEYQRMTWDALRKSINGLVNKVNAINIKNIIPELFAENLIRGRGLFCRSCMKSQMASPGFTDIFAALVAVANTKFPEIGELLLKRIILQLQKAYRRNYKPQLLAAVKFMAHLVNQQVVHELIALELLTVLLENPTDDSVEVAVGFVTECGSMLQDLCPRGLHGIFERFRGILHEGEIDKRVQFLIEGLFALRKSKFQGYPAVRPELDLVEQEDQLTHEISLSDEIDPEIALDIFKPDPDFLENEKKYEELKKSILGEGSDEEADSDDGDSDGEDEEESEGEEEERMKIQDETETNLVNLRRTIYLTIMSSVDFEEAGHKLLKIKLEPGQEMELCIMLLECCSQERTYLRYYGLLGQRFCMINKVHQVNFETCFVQQYSMIHRLETNKLRNVAKFFAHLLGTDALPWHVLSYIRLTEEDTTSSSRIFIKILFQELSEHLGIRLLNERLNDPTVQESFESIFPKDNPKNTRFSINFFTSIGLGGITENLREYLKNMPRLIMQQQKPASESEESNGSGSDDSDSSGSASSSSSDDNESESDSGRDEKRRKRRKRT